MTDRYRHVVTVEKTMSPLDVARGVKIALKAIKEDGVSVSPESERRVLRHEVAHVIAMDHGLVDDREVSGYVDTNEPNSYRVSIGTSIKDVGWRSKFAMIKSSLAPLGDRRIGQSLSSEDENVVVNAILSFFKK